MALVGRADVLEAARRLRGVVRATPALERPALSDLAGRPVVLKPESTQRTGSFKIRGAYNHISRLPTGLAVVAASAGNHAQGVALAARLSGRESVVFMPAGVSLPKLDATRAYGAEVRVVGGGIEEALAAARAYADQAGQVFVPPFDDARVIAGQATVGLELAREAPELEAVVVPTGGGGLVAGVGAALAEWAPGVRVVAVQAAGFEGLAAALAAGHPVEVPGGATLADGIAVRSVSELTLAHARAFVHEVVTVTDEEIARAVLMVLERGKWLVEPAGAAGLAAVLAGKVAGSGPVGVVLSGGNVDPLVLSHLIDYGLDVEGRFLTLTVRLPDRPGALAGLTGLLGQMGLNVLEVIHRRSGVRAGLGVAEVGVTVETRDPGHRAATRSRLKRAGYIVTEEGTAGHRRR